MDSTVSSSPAKTAKKPFLTDYVILESQCPLWQAHTDNVREVEKLQHHLMQSGLNPRGCAGLLERLKDTPFFTAWRIFRLRRNYKLVITGDTQVGLFYALLCKISGGGNSQPPQLLIDFMLHKPRKNVLWGVIKRFQKFTMSAIECVIVFSKSEIETYARLLDLPAQKFQYLPYHTNILKPSMVANHKGYIFSAGRSGRDYKTLLEAARDLPYPVHLVSDPDSLAGLDIPENVKVHYNAQYDKYLQLLADAQVVVVPLKPDIRSLGMVVMLEAMAMGKPVITTRAVSNVEYIRDGENGLFVNPGDEKDLKNKLEYLYNRPEEGLKLGRQALDDVLRCWTFEKYVQAVLDTAYKIAEGQENN